MAGSSLQIDDDYCKKMGQYYVNEGEKIESFINEYITILKNIKGKAIISGEVADALEVYIEYASLIKGQINSLSKVAKSQITGFISAIDTADQYLF